MYLSQTDSLVTNPQDLVVEHHGWVVYKWMEAAVKSVSWQPSCVVNNYEDNSWAFIVIYKCLFA